MKTSLSSVVPECQHLLRLQTSEAEHPDLVDDVLPVVRRTLLLQPGHQLLSHLDDAVGHTMDLLQPGHRDSSGNIRSFI